MIKDIVISSEKSTLELKKHVAVIHSNSKISLLQRKISNALLFHAYDNLLTRDEHVIQIPVLTKLIGYDSHDHKTIKRALMDLLATVIEWNIVDGDKLDKDNVWNASSIIADVSIDGSFCTYSYSGKMRKLLYHPSVYGRLNMDVQSRFQSNYGLALYENCNRYQDIGQTPWFDIQKFRKLMGVDDNKYKIFRDFKTRVLDKSIEEVNKYSSLNIEPKFKKNNRQTVGIQFLIKKQNTHDQNNDQLEFNKDDLLNILKNDFGLSKNQISSLVNNYDEGYINEKIMIIKNSPSYISGKIKNLGNYLLSAISNDYQPIKKSIPKEHNKNKKESSPIQISENKKVKIEFFEIYNQLNHDRKKELLSLFENKIKKTVYASMYAKYGLEDALVNDQFAGFILSFKNEITEHLEIEKPVFA